MRHKGIFLLLGFLMLGWIAAPMTLRAEEGEKAAPAKEEGKAADKKEEGAEDKKGEGKKEEGGKDKAPAGVSGGRFAGDPVYVHLDPLVLPMVTEQGAEQLITVQIDVEVKDFDVADNIHSNMPRVRDALVRALYGGLSQGNLRIGKMVDVNKIKARATTALKDVVGADGIRNVLIQNIAQRVL